MPYLFNENNFLTYNVSKNDSKLLDIKLFTHSEVPVILEKERIVIFITILKQAALGKLNDKINIVSDFEDYLTIDKTPTSMNFHALLEFSQLKNNNTVYLEVLLKSLTAKNKLTGKTINLVIPPKKTLTNFEMHYYIELFSKMSINWL